MELTDRFAFGKYQGLTLQEVFQGTLHISKDLLQRYVEFKFTYAETTAYYEMIRDFNFELIRQFKVGNDTITVSGLYLTMDDDAPELGLGNVENTLQAYLSNEHMFNMQNTPGFVSLSQYNSNHGNLYVTDGDPTYLNFCIQEIDGFYIRSETMKFLENLHVCYLDGFNVAYLKENIYLYAPRMVTGKFKFSEQIKEINAKKISGLGFGDMD